MKIDSADFGGKPSFNDAILALETGDSAQFYLNGVDFFTLTMKESIPTFLNPTDSVKFIVKIKKILSKAEYAAEMKRDAERREEREKDIRDQYLDRENITQKPNISGLIVIPLKQGKGRKILTGEIAQVQFLGSFINGKVFDSTSDDKPAEFVLGSPDVIPAWNEAVAGMSVGDKIQIIVPSQLAYGKDGLDDLIPPYSTLIYVIELKSIKK
jgi:FKBP-type peptidyl-prolyl cis-trans isomerase